MKLLIDCYHVGLKIEIDVEPRTLVRDLLASLRLRTNYLRMLRVPTRLVLLLKESKDVGTLSLQEDQYLDSYEVKEGDKLYLVEGRVQVDVVMLVDPFKGPQGGEKTVSLIFPTKGTCAKAVRDALRLDPKSHFEHRLVYQNRILSDHEIIPCAYQNVPTLHLHIGEVSYFDMGHSTPISFFRHCHQTPEQVFQDILQPKVKLVPAEGLNLVCIPNQSIMKLSPVSCMQILVKLCSQNNYSILLDVEPSYTIKQVKYLIQLQSVIETCKFYLEFEGKKLTCEDNTLKYYNIESESVLLCKSYWQVFLKDLTGKTHTCHTTPEQKVVEFKRENALKVGFCTNVGFLLFGGRYMEIEKTLADYDVSDESTIHAMLKLSHTNGIPCKNCELNIMPCVGNGTQPNFIITKEYR